MQATDPCAHRRATEEISSSSSSRSSRKQNTINIIINNNINSNNNINININININNRHRGQCHLIFVHLCSTGLLLFCVIGVDADREWCRGHHDQGTLDAQKHTPRAVGETAHTHHTQKHTLTHPHTCCSCAKPLPTAMWRR